MATTVTGPNGPPRFNSQRWRLDNIDVRYDRKTDILHVRTRPLVPSGGVYGGPHDEVLLLVSIGDDEAVGFQIENFRAVWLKTHPEGQAAFRRANRRLLAHLFGTTWSTFKRVIVNTVTQEVGLPDSRLCLS